MSHPDLLSSAVEISPEVAKIVRRQRIQDFFFERTTQFFAFFVLAALTGILISLAVAAWPTLKTFGPSFLWTVEWDVVDDKYGAAIAIFGTVVSSIIALVIAVPLSFGIALFLTETCPVWLRRPLGVAVELLAGVPSIIYGMFGLFIFAPLFADYMQPILAATLGQIPVIGVLFSGANIGIGMLTAGLILAIMVLPFIASVMRDVFDIVPSILKESAYGMWWTTNTGRPSPFLER